MSYDNGSSSGGCLSGLITLLLLPYIIIFYGYALLALMALMILEWIRENILTILLYVAPVVVLIVIIKLGIPRAIYRAIKEVMNKAPQEVESDVQPNSAFTPSSDTLRSFTPSTNLYCYWCTRKLGLQSFKFKGRYYCQSCHEKVDKK
jgi:hypothetical protein